MDIAGKQIDGQGSISEEDFYEILSNYGTVSDDKSTLTTTKGNYEILISDIYSGEIDSSLTTTTISDWQYQIAQNGENVFLTKYIGTESKIFIPSTFEIDGNIYTTRLYWSNNVPNIGPFINNSNIVEVKFDENVQVFSNDGSQLFYNCVNLKKVYNLPKGYTNLNSAFQGCVSLEEAPLLYEGIEQLKLTFNKCTSLRKVSSIPSTVINMNSTFKECNYLSGNIKINAENVTDIEDCFSSTSRIIILSIDKSSLTYSNFRNKITVWKNIYFDGEAIYSISCWGDSLTAGLGGSGTTYPDELSKLLNRKAVVYDMGVGGETTGTIAGRQGGIPFITNEFIIPDTTTPVEINLIGKDGSDVNPCKGGFNGLNPCTILGITGDISYSDNKLYFTRRIAGKATTVKSGTEVITAGMQFNKGDIMILWTGSNDSINSSTIQSTIEKQMKMIEYNDNDKYIVIGLTSKHYMSDVSEINSELSKKYNNKFLDIRAKLLDIDYLTSMWNLILSEDDILDIKNGEIPSSLRIDDIHFNAKGYEIIANLVYQKLNSLGYITE